ncbi:39S ribosomal protein L1, mitochondrial isoform X3 [Eptesicus fuscus]|uniref:39S ribosomal protein L1, mitochondrial isoform X3 n=1 Tax=Eptesicus fuscus TaxID=29078 RepID=UPI002403EEF6|nr:39S ribosomal protein L1, mitochondrial isoform X3 [Eptesicus fuscus]
MANMAAAVRCLWRVVIHQRHNLSKMAYQTPLYPCSACVHVPNRHFAAAARKSEKKTKKGTTKEKASNEKKEDDIEKIKSIPFMEGEPEDDVYLKRLYPRQIYEKKVEPFASVVSLPYPFASEINKVAVFTANASEIKIAEEHGAAFAGGTNLIQKILDDEIEPDFYVAVPEIMPELNPLKKKLKKKFPKLNRNSIGRDIPKMLELFKTGIEINVDEERENFLSTKIATLDMSSDQITANLQAVIDDVCRHRPLNLGPFVVRAFLRSSTSEGLLLKMEPFLPKEVETKESSREAA